MKTPEQQFGMSPEPERQADTPVSLESDHTPMQETPPQTIDQIKQILFDAHVISKRQDQEGREVAAAEIFRRRQESRSLRTDIGGRENTLAQIEQQTQVLRSVHAEKLLDLEQRTENVLVRLKNILNIKDRAAGELETQIGFLTTEIETLATEAEETRMELAMLKGQQENIPDPQKLLEAYYKKMETVPLTNAEKRELLKPEMLAELSTEE